MRVTGLTTKLMDLVLTSMLMEQCMKDNGSTINKKGMAKKYGLMEVVSKASTKMARSMVGANSCGQMGQTT